MERAELLARLKAVENKLAQLPEACWPQAVAPLLVTVAKLEDGVEWATRDAQSWEALAQWAEAAARVTGASLAELVKPQRAQSTVVARQVAMFLCRAKNPPASFPMIGSVFARDHSTVITAVRNIEARMERSKSFALYIRQAQRRLSALMTEEAA